MMWKSFEQRIRDIASFRWNKPAIAETIAGIKCDCVLKESDRWIVIEITQENSLEKVRRDITKLLTVRNSLFIEGIYCQCYFVMQDKPTDSMRQSGEAQRIKVMSGMEFQNEYFEYDNYLYARKQKQFGSLINMETGRPEENSYIRVAYRNKKDGNEVYIDDIIDLLLKGRKIVLKGDFGLGKSRCVKEVFDCLSNDQLVNPYVIAINLRDHWGAKRAQEILLRHFEDMGLRAGSIIKTFDNANFVYLLDGFDEIGTQSWSSDIQRMQHIREISVCALKDLISKVQGGILITGRDYYFNSDDEMLSCLGLDDKQTIILECHSEFTETELLEFMSQNIPELTEKGKIKQLPVWFPKRPLVIQLMQKYAEDMFSVEHTLDDICSFWYVLLSKICEREAKIYPALNPEVIKKVLLYLADITRFRTDNVGPITQNDLSDAFISAAGITPNDETAIMLQRLPSLGRISADSPDRQFLDSFILDGLRAESIIQLSKSWNAEVFQKEWINPLNQIGLGILAEYIGNNSKRRESFFLLARNASSAKNQILAADIVSALCMLSEDYMDFREVVIDGGYFSNLSFEGKEIQRLTIMNSIIDKLDLTNSKMAENVEIRKSIISTIYGISSKDSIPSQFYDCEVKQFEMLATNTLVKRARLSDSQKILAEMIHKLFFQPGKGRREETLLRETAGSSNKKLSQNILSELVKEKLVKIVPGDEGDVYKPVRRETGRMDKMLTDLTLSKDPLWIKVTEMG
ncbi:MAG TPA: hypothetical protein DCR27_12835 [Lachnospiraceae bacterium]|nr:hypothetical protein [Lachnospiraceae bacterium]